MTDWTPENNRIQTMHLTPIERSMLGAAKYGWLMWSYDGTWVDVPPPVEWVARNTYRAKPAPVTQDVVPWEAIADGWDWCARDKTGNLWLYDEKPYDGGGTMWLSHGTEMRDVDSVLAGYTPGTCDWRDSLQQRPQPAATGAVTEPLAKAGLGLKRIVEEIDGAMKHGTWRDEHGMRLKDTPEWVEFYNALTEAAAVAHAKRMTGWV